MAGPAVKRALLGVALLALAAPALGQPYYRTGDPGWGDLGTVVRPVFPTANLSASGELEVEEPTPVNAVSFVYNVNTALVTPVLAAAGTVYQANAMAVLATSSGTTDSAQLETLYASRYVAGIGSRGTFSAMFSPCIPNSQQEVGKLTSQNGYGFGCSSVTGGFGVLRRSGGTDYWTAQSAWNVDTLSGSGQCAFKLNPSALNVYRVSYLWHGAGPISYWVSNGQRWCLVHVTNWVASGATQPHSLNPYLPLHARVYSTGTTTPLSISIGSMGDFIEGRDPTGSLPVLGIISSAYNVKDAGATETALISFKNKAANVYGGTNTNTVRVKLMSISLGATATAPTFRVLRNTTLGGTPSFSDLSTLTSVLQTDTAGTTVSGGTELYSGVVQTGTNREVDMSGYNIYLNPGDVITIDAAASGSVPPGAFASARWLEMP